MSMAPCQQEEETCISILSLCLPSYSIKHSVWRGQSMVGAHGRAWSLGDVHGYSSGFNSLFPWKWLQGARSHSAAAVANRGKGSMAQNGGQGRRRVGLQDGAAATAPRWAAAGWTPWQRPEEVDVPLGEEARGTDLLAGGEGETCPFWGSSSKEGTWGLRKPCRASPWDLRTDLSLHRWNRTRPEQPETRARPRTSCHDSKIRENLHCPELSSKPHESGFEEGQERVKHHPLPRTPRSWSGRKSWWRDQVASNPTTQESGLEVVETRLKHILDLNHTGLFFFSSSSSSFRATPAAYGNSQARVE